MNKVSNYQKIILLVITAINIATGFIRYNSVINFLDLDQLVFKRNKLKFSYPHNLSSFIDSLIMDPRWLSNIYYFLIAVLSTYITARILFWKRKVCTCALLLQYFNFDLYIVSNGYTNYT